MRTEKPDKKYVYKNVSNYPLWGFNMFSVIYCRISCSGGHRSILCLFMSLLEEVICMDHMMYIVMILFFIVVHG